MIYFESLSIFVMCLFIASIVGSVSVLHKDGRLDAMNRNFPGAQDWIDLEKGKEKNASIVFALIYTMLLLGGIGVIVPKLMHTGFSLTVFPVLSVLFLYAAVGQILLSRHSEKLLSYLIGRLYAFTVYLALWLSVGLVLYHFIF